MTDAKGDKFLVLSKGRRYVGVPTQPDFELMEFEHFHQFLSHKGPELVENQSAESLPTQLLLANMTPVNLSELMYRIALPMMSFSLLLLAIPLSFVNPRAGRSANTGIALLLFFTYLNFVNMVQAMIMQGRLSFMLAWWPIHVAVILIVTFLFSWRLKMKVPSQYHPHVIVGLHQARGFGKTQPEMKTLQRYIASEIFRSVLLVLICGVALLTFFDLMSELKTIGQGGYNFYSASLYVILGMPAYVNLFMPIAVVIGTILTLVQFAARSEFTIMRASSMSTGMIGWTLFKIAYGVCGGHLPVR